MYLSSFQPLNLSPSFHSQGMLQQIYGTMARFITYLGMMVAMQVLSCHRDILRVSVAEEASCQGLRAATAYNFMSMIKIALG